MDRVILRIASAGSEIVDVPSSGLDNRSLMGFLDLGVVQAIQRHVWLAPGRFDPCGSRSDWLGGRPAVNSSLASSSPVGGKLVLVGRCRRTLGIPAGSRRSSRGRTTAAAAVGEGSSGEWRGL